MLGWGHRAIGTIAARDRARRGGANRAGSTAGRGGAHRHLRHVEHGSKSSAGGGRLARRRDRPTARTARIIAGGGEPAGIRGFAHEAEIHGLPQSAGRPLQRPDPRADYCVANADDVSIRRRSRRGSRSSSSGSRSPSRTHRLHRRGRKCGRCGRVIGRLAARCARSRRSESRPVSPDSIIATRQSTAPTGAGLFVALFSARGTGGRRSGRRGRRDRRRGPPDGFERARRHFGGGRPRRRHGGGGGGGGLRCCCHHAALPGRLSRARRGGVERCFNPEGTNAVRLEPADAWRTGAVCRMRRAPSIAETTSARRAGRRRDARRHRARGDAPGRLLDGAPRTMTAVEAADLERARGDGASTGSGEWRGAGRRSS